MHKNEEFCLTIDDLTTSGSGIGRHDGMAVFVEGALPGEEVKVHIIKVKKNYAIGKLLEVVSPSPLRTKPRCPVFGKCGGCTLQDLAYAGQLSYKHERVEGTFKHLANLDTELPYPLPSIEQWRYRNKAAYALENRNGKILIGFYASHSHHVVDIDDCLIQPEYTKLILSQLRVWIEKSQVPIYDESTGEGLLRHVVIRSNAAGEYMLVLVINGDDIPDRKRLLQLFKLALPRVTSIVLNINTERTNVIMGRENRTIVGPGFLFEDLCGLSFRFGPSSFLQINHHQTEAMYRFLLRTLNLRTSETVFDLFCGVGTISLLAAQRAGKVIGVEEVEAAVENARFNALLNEIDNAEFHAGDASAILQQLLEGGTKPDVVIVDPPRKGLSKDTIQAISQASPRAIGYVSCDPATLARDLALFKENGYILAEEQSFDLFPQTTHVESVALLTKG